MEYRKPSINVPAKAIGAIEGSNTAGKGTNYFDGPFNPGGRPPLRNDVIAAYESDE